MHKKNVTDPVMNTSTSKKEAKLQHQYSSAKKQTNTERDRDNTSQSNLGLSQDYDNKILKKSSKEVRDLVTSVKSSIRAKSDKYSLPKVDKKVNEMRKKLEELRLQDCSQDTRLLKIQKDERQVNVDYRNKKKKIQEQLENLAEDGEKFNEDQRRMNAELEKNKTDIVYISDQKRKKELLSTKQDHRDNEERKKDIIKFKKQEQDKKEELRQLEEQRDNLMIYKSFLQEIYKQCDEFDKDEKDDQTHLDLILNHHRKQKKMENDLKNDQIQIENDQKANTTRFYQIEYELNQEELIHTSHVNSINQKIEVENQKILNLQKEYEGKINEINSRLQDYVQIYLSIKNCYENITKNAPQQQIKDTEKDTSKDLINKLKTIQKQLILLNNVWDKYQEINKGSQNKEK